MFCCVEQNESEFISKRSQKYQNSDFVFLFCFLSLKMAWAECNVWNFKRNRNQVCWVLSTVQVLSALARRGARYGYTRNVGTFGHHGAVLGGKGKLKLTDGVDRNHGGGWSRDCEPLFNWSSQTNLWNGWVPSLKIQFDYTKAIMTWICFVIFRYSYFYLKSHCSTLP